MKRQNLFKSMLCLLLGLVCHVAWAAVTPPTFSTEDAPEWYMIQFTAGSAVLSDQGADLQVTTAAKAITEANLWQFVGTKESFYLKSYKGNYLYRKGDGKYATTASADGKTLLALDERVFGQWDIHRPDVSNGLNQVGGAGTGKELSEWTAGDTNNQLQVVSLNAPTITNLLLLSNNKVYTLRSKRAQLYYSDAAKIQGVSSFTPANPNTLWYTTSAEATGVSYPWMEYGLPLGNGELGCMVFGGVLKEELQFNEKTLWRGPANVVGASGGNRTFVNFGSLFVKNMDETLADGVAYFTGYMEAVNYAARLHVEADEEAEVITTDNGIEVKNATEVTFYLKVPATVSTNALRIRFADEETTSIDALESTANSQQPTAVYDLAGRRVEKMEKGIYIVNGRKVVK